ncbi:MAG: TIM barrel protein [Opitutaceae bacterium]|nr:TIM barrel protein [Opitutaceae bacterium]
MNRRELLRALAVLASARAVLAAAGAPAARLGLCSFSSHQHWRAAGTKHPGVKFSDALGFYRHARELGGAGVQTGLRGATTETARELRALVERDGGYYEAELRLPRQEGETAAFEKDVALARAAGATVARAVFTSGRRYEEFKTAAAFREYHDRARQILARIEPIARRHRLKIAIENHKDLTTDEQVTLIRGLASEWIGVLVDTGNNLALLEEPYATMEALAPFALSVHLKDMALQPAPDGFLLSEVPLGTGFLDLPRIVATLRRANPALVLNLEMATRDPLRIPCLTDGYYATFPADYRARLLAPALARVQAHPPRGPVPAVAGKPTDQVLAEEEAHNRHGLAWMKTNLRT